MTWPSSATKVHLDSATDDPKQARTELADHIDQFNTLIAHFSSLAQSLVNDASQAAMQSRLGLVIGTDVQADLAVPSDGEVDAGTATTERVWTAAKVKRAVDTHSTGAIESGTVMLFYQTDVPTGWTRVTTAGIDKHAMVIDTQSSLTGFTGSKGGANEFATAFNGTVASGTHAGTTPSHTHEVMNTGGGSGGNTYPTSPYYITAGGFANNAGSRPSTLGGGGGGTHSHTIDVDVAYINIFLASKDA